MNKINADLISLENILRKITPFSLDDSDKTEKYGVFLNNIKKIYLYLNIYCLEGNFLRDSASDKILIDIIDVLIDDFDKKNDGNSTSYLLTRRILITLKENIKEIYKINQISKHKRKKYLVNKEYQNKRIDNNNILEKILHYNISILKLEFQFRLIIDNEIYVKRLLLYDEISNLCKEINGEYSWIMDILKEKMLYNLGKIAKFQGENHIRWKNKYGEVETINNPGKIIKTTSFESQWRTFLYLFGIYEKPPGDKTVYHKNLEESNYKDNLSLNILIFYYKKEKNKEKLLELYNNYKKHFDTRPSYKNTYINYVFLGNNYLSLLVKIYKEGKKTNAKLEQQIQKIFHEVEQEKKSYYQNYFSCYKYAEFKLYCSINLIKNKQFTEAKKMITGSKHYIEKAINILQKDFVFEYFEYSNDENIVNLEWNDKIPLKKIYCYNIFGVPFNKEEQKKKLNKLQQEIFKTEITAIYEERVDSAEQEYKNSKFDAITMIGIFTGIVVYSFGTIQIFSIIENIGDAILFSGIFLSGILFLMGSIFFKIYPDLSENLRRNKGLGLFLIGIIVLIATISLKWIYQGDIIHSNKINNLNNELKKTIESAKSINIDLNEKTNTIK